MFAHILGLEPRQHFLGEKAEIGFRHFVRHTAVAEDTDSAAGIDHALMVHHLLVHLVRRAPDLQVGKKIHERVDAVLVDILG